MPPTKDIDVVFFDIGGTLGEPDRETGGLAVYPSSAGLLRALRDEVGLRIGVITTLGPLSDEQGSALLAGAGLAGFLDPQGFVSEHEAGAAKPDPAIYRFAAAKVGVPAGRCLFVGENLVEVIGALSAGMQALLKPCPPGRELTG